MTETGGLHYIHARIDQLVRQTALEVGLLRLYAGADRGVGNHEAEDHALGLTQQRFWAAQDVAADEHGQEHRAR